MGDIQNGRDNMIHTLLWESTTKQHGQHTNTRAFFTLTQAAITTEGGELLFDKKLFSPCCAMGFKTSRPNEIRRVVLASFQER